MLDYPIRASVFLPYPAPSPVPGKGGSTVSTKVIFGETGNWKPVCNSQRPTRRSTPFVERENLTVRQRNRRLPRKANGSSKELSWQEKQL